MSTTTKQQDDLTFNAEEREKLQTLAGKLSYRLGLEVIYETSAVEDGDEYATLELAEPQGRHFGPLATVQLIRRPARGYGLMQPNGQTYGAETWRKSYGGDFDLTMRHAEQLAVRSFADQRTLG